MIDLDKWVWIVDRKEMICRNAEHNVTVKMVTEDGEIKGKLHHMPMELFGEIAGISSGEKIIERIVKMAEEKYQKK